jgi:hypothetical protein
MNLTNPITITPPSITKKDGTVKNFDPIVLAEARILELLGDNPSVVLQNLFRN